MLIQNKYNIIEKIGEGTFSTVYKAEHILKKHLVAIKCEKKGSKISKKLFENEIRIYLELLKHKRHKIVNIKSFGCIGTQNYIIMELLYMDLETFFKQNINIIDIDTIDKLFNQCITLIKNLHNTGFVHRDIKPDNFLFDKNDDLCMIDLGLSARYDKNKSFNKMIGSTMFCAPDVHQEYCVYQKEYDIISIYYMFFYLITKELPWSRVHIDSEKLFNSTLYSIKKYTNFLDFYEKKTYQNNKSKFIVLEYVKKYNYFIINHFNI